MSVLQPPDPSDAPRFAAEQRRTAAIAAVRPAPRPAAGALNALHGAAIRLGYGLAYRDNAIERKRRSLETTQWWPRERVLAYQFSRLQHLLRYAYARVPYYRRLFDSLDLSPADIRTPADYRRLPILTKADIRAHEGELLAEGIDVATLTRTGSGGSTGAPVALYHDDAMIAGSKAAKLRNFAWAGWRPGDAWARLWGNNFDVAPHEQWRMRMWDRMTRVRWLTCFDLTDLTMAEYAAELARFQPDVIEAYVNPLYLFARFLETRGLAGTIRPRGVITSAETLFPHQREAIERVFGCKVYNRYGGREAGDVAHECPAGTMHLNAETIYTEFEREGHPCEPGEPGAILLTPLDLYAFPLLRYQVEDMGSPSDAVCACGRGLPAMHIVEGRVQDLITMKSGRYLTGVFFAHLFKDYDVAQWQAVQETLEELTVKVVPGPKLSEDDRTSILMRLQEYTHGELAIELLSVAGIPLTASGKHRPTLSKVPPDLLQDRRPETEIP
ncbi:MAG: phenylacetate--CoA ligase family protein [Chloroflexi bacterium]|nr:phenylacetate--CoA ligase family protein [Chloroflexota bacterium]